MQKRFIKYLLLSLPLLYIAASLVWWVKLSSKPVIVYIQPGASAYEISVKLKQAGVINSSKFFLLAAKVTGSIKQLKAGTYEISPKESIFEIINMLAKGKAKYIRITIPEGFTGLQIAKRLSEQGVVNEGAFNKLIKDEKLEGYLFPETYYFERNMPEVKVINRMLEQFNVHFSSDMKKRANSMKHMNEKNIVILASIIEKEARLDAERPLISAVFHNRLKKHMFLESCATVLYAIGEHKATLCYKDLEVNSPYNTYRHYGLPLGPICNPGMESIKAALYPAGTDDLFFVVSDSGTHSFSKYYREHLQKKIERKKIRNKNKK